MTEILDQIIEAQKWLGLPDRPDVLYVHPMILVADGFEEGDFYRDRKLLLDSSCLGVKGFRAISYWEYEDFFYFFNIEDKLSLIKCRNIRDNTITFHYD